MATIYKSAEATLSIGATKGVSLAASLGIGAAKSASFAQSLQIGNHKSASVNLDVKAGYAFVSWTYDAANKRAVGTLVSPLYHSANFALKATEGLKNTRAKKIKNPQEIEYTTV
jgi:hypothetical protein